MPLQVHISFIQVIKYDAFFMTIFLFSYAAPHKRARPKFHVSEYQDNYNLNLASVN